MDSSLSDSLKIAEQWLEQPLLWIPLWLLATLGLAALVGGLVPWQLRALGLAEGGRGRVDWPRVFGLLAAWATALMGLAGLSDRLHLLPLTSLLEAAARTVIGGAPAAAILAGVSHYARLREQRAEEQGEAARAAAEGELKGVWAAGAGLAALTQVGGVGSLLLLPLGVALLVALVPELRRRAVAAWENVAAGAELGRRLPAGTRRMVGEHAIEGMGSPGLLATWVREDGEARLIDNTTLLARLREQEPG